MAKMYANQSVGMTLDMFKILFSGVDLGYGDLPMNGVSYPTLDYKVMNMRIALNQVALRGQSLITDLKNTNELYVTIEHVHSWNGANGVEADPYMNMPRVEDFDDLKSHLEATPFFTPDAFAAGDGVSYALLPAEGKIVKYEGDQEPVEVLPTMFATVTVERITNTEESNS